MGHVNKSLMAVSKKKPVVIRKVWEENLEIEFWLIKKVLKDYPYASIDTEFPGIVAHPPLEKNVKFSRLTPAYTYYLMKTNVDALNIIQLGLTLSDAEGNLPDFGEKSCFIWEFNFREFDMDKDTYNRKSVELLQRQGIDFLKNKEKGVRSDNFSRLFFESFCNVHPNLTWVTFHGAYDFGFLIKMLMQRDLPPDLHSFMCLLGFYFGFSVYDTKQMMKFCGLHGGLECMAKNLDVCRAVGKSHQAASDSLLTMQAFMKMRDMYFCGDNVEVLDQITGVPYGLNLEVVVQSGRLDRF